jgi:hypothetical protein
MKSEVSAEVLSRFIYFVNERENMRIRKASGHPGPWTTDPILQKYRFCNIRRRDDRVSQWLLKNYYPRMTGPDIWLAAVVARLINWPPTLDALLEAELNLDDVDSFDGAGFKFVISMLKKEPEFKVYTSAYLVYPGHKVGSPANKEEFLCDTVLAGLIRIKDKVREAVRSNSIENTVTALSAPYGMATFMSGQAAADLTYLFGQLDKATDLYTFAPRGPGSQRGLNYLYNLKPSHSWTSEDFCEALIRVNIHIKEQLNIADLTLHDIQNCFCEAAKIEGVLRGESRPRSQYRPETAY